MVMIDDTDEQRLLLSLIFTMALVAAITMPHVEHVKRQPLPEVSQSQPWPLTPPICSPSRAEMFR